MKDNERSTEEIQRELIIALEERIEMNKKEFNMLEKISNKIRKNDKRIIVNYKIIIDNYYLILGFLVNNPSKKVIKRAKEMVANYYKKD